MHRRRSFRRELAGQPVFTYLANTLRRGDREIPYSLVTATDLRAIAPAVPPRATAEGPPFPIALNQWAARELQAAVGDPITMEYYVWEEPGQLATRTSEFRVAAVVPIDAGDRDLAPVYPGISDSPSLADWDPPFPIDLRRIRPADEAYWNEYRTTPKAFVPLEVGQGLWRSRYGALTSIRTTPPEGEPVAALQEVRDQVEQRLRARIDPLAGAGLVVRDVRAEGLSASRGATDFGEYFVYFSFFLVVSALLLVVLFFKLGVEQRAREVGLLRAVGFKPAAVRQLFLYEGLLLSIVGSGAGVRRRAGVRLPDHDRARHVVGGRRGNQRLDAARVVDLARRGRRRGSGGGDCLHLVDAAKPRAHFGAESAGGTD